MRSLNRREVLIYGLSVTIPLISGCFDSEDGLDVIARNADTAVHRVGVKVSGDFAERDMKHATLAPDEQITFKRLVPILDYDHEFEIRVDVDGGVVGRMSYRLTDFNPIEITIESDESVSFRY